MSLAGDEVNSNYKEKLESQLKLNKHLFNTKMKEYLEYIKLEKDGKKSKYFSEPTQELLYSGISDSGLKLIGIKYKNTYFQLFLEVNYPEIYNKQNRVPPKGGRKTKSKKSNRRNTRKHRKSRKSRKSRK